MPCKIFCILLPCTAVYLCTRGYNNLSTTVLQALPKGKSKKLYQGLQRSLNLLTGCLSSSGERLFLQFYCSEWDFCKVRKQQKLIIRLVFGVHSFMWQVKNGRIKKKGLKTPRWKVALTRYIFNQQLLYSFLSKFNSTASSFSVKITGLFL